MHTSASLLDLHRRTHHSLKGVLDHARTVPPEVIHRTLDAIANEFDVPGNRIGRVNIFDRVASSTWISSPTISLVATMSAMPASYRRPAPHRPG